MACHRNIHPQVHKQLKLKKFFSPYNNVFLYSHTGLPLHEVGKGGGKISGGKFKTINRNKGVEGSCMRKSKETKLESDCEKDEGEEPWMEAQTSRKKRKTSVFLLVMIKNNSLI